MLSNCQVKIEFWKELESEKKAHISESLQCGTVFLFFASYLCEEGLIDPAKETLCLTSTRLLQWGIVRAALVSVSPFTVNQWYEIV